MATTKRDYRLLSERMALVAGVAYPLSAVPQAVSIYAHHNASGLSLVSWLGFTLIELVFLFYGLVNKLRPLILTGFMWLAVYAFIIFGIVYYG